MNVATVEYSTTSGAASITAVDSAVVVVGQVAGVDIEPPRTATAMAGTTVVFPHTLTNLGNGTDAFALGTTPPPGWSAAELYHDVDGDGILSGADTLIAGPVTLEMGGTFSLLVAQPVPAATSVGSFTVDLFATSQFDGTTSDAVTDAVDVVLVDPNDEISVRKSVNEITVTPGRTVTYTIDVGIGAAGADAVSIADTLPAQVRYEPGSLRVDGAPISDDIDGDEGAFLSSEGIVQWRRLAPDTGTVRITFEATLDASTPEGTTVRNGVTASLDLGALGTGVARSNASFTSAERPAPTIRKTVQSANPVRPGDDVVYRIEIENQDEVLSLTGLTLHDTLPSPLTLQGAVPTPTSSTDRVLVWREIDLAPGETRTFEIRARVDAVETETVFTNTARVADRFGGTADDSSEPRTALPPLPPTPTELDVDKTVDRTSALPGDELLWTVTARVTGDATVNEVLLSDTIPAGADYVSGSLTLDGSPLTDHGDADAGVFDPETREVLVRATDIAPGRTLVLTLRARVSAEALELGAVLNRAHAVATTDDRTVSASDTAQTTVQAVSLGLSKRLLGDADTLRAGDEASFEIVVTNTTGRALHDVVVTDVLPGPLEPIDADPMWSRRPNGGQTLVWDLGTLETDASRVLRIRARADTTAADTTVANRAAISGLGVRPDSATSDPVTIVADDPPPPPTPSISLTLDAERLEVEPGDRLPLRASLLNDGEVPITDLRIDIDVPRGTRYFDQEIVGVFLEPGSEQIGFREVFTAPGSGEASGLGIQAPAGPVLPDSVVRTPTGFSLWVPATLEPGYRFEFTYQILILSGAEGTLESRARATGLRGDEIQVDVEARVVASFEATARVILRRARLLETRMILGRVFVDLDGDGIQDIDEPGVPNAEIWTEDGEVVRTDVFGKYSLVNMRPGRHAVRLDPASLPDSVEIAENGQAAGTEWVELTGWISGTANFPVRPRTDFVAPRLSEGQIGDSVAALAPVRVAAARTDSIREAGAGDSFLHGPGVRFFNPVDGLVSSTNRVFLGVRGEPGTPLQLLRGDTVLETTVMRPDGIYDFVGTELVPGPQLFRIQMTNSWGQVREDSLVVHLSGTPVEFVAPEGPIRLAAGGLVETDVRFRLLDAWGVPVTHHPAVTVSVTGGRITSADSDPTSVGHQVLADEYGWVDVTVVGADETGTGELVAKARDLESRVEIVVEADARSLLVVGGGQLTVGSGGESFAAVTARGSLDDRTALTVSYDSRTLDQDRESFGRIDDPLADDRYALVGDASEQRSVAESRYSLYAKVERGLDWAVFGDIREGWFTEGLGLARYSRAVPGAAARVTTGDIVWNAFGAMTEQSLRQLQFRGSGTSGPFELDGEILPGTDRVMIEARARENASRIVNQETLRRFLDYEIDYENGVVLLKRPLPAEDPFGNPLYLVVGFESRSSGEKSLLYGLRGSTDLMQAFASPESAVRLPFSASVVRDEQAGAEYTLGAMSASLESGNGASLAVEVAYADAVDSTGVASRVEGQLSLMDERLLLTGRWGQVGDEFTNPSNAAVRPGVRELQLGGRLTSSWLNLSVDYEEQVFETLDRERSRTSATLTRNILESLGLSMTVANDRSGQAGVTAEATAAEAALNWQATDRLSLKAEGREELAREGLIASLGSWAGAGASFRLNDKVSLDGRHRQVRPGGTQDDYHVTSVGLTSRVTENTNAWGSYQLSGSAGEYVNAAVVGLDHQLSIGDDVRLQGMIERRKGIGAAAPGDAVLASPFQQREEDYFSVALGAEYVPQAKPYRASVRAETRDGTDSRTNLLRVAGDVAITPDLGILSRQEFMEQDRPLAGGRGYRRDRASVWGLAYRPNASNTLAFLGKFEWRDALNPRGQTLLQGDGEETRVIGALEAFWQPATDIELTGRVAMRSATAVEFVEDGRIDREVSAQFVGGSVRYDFNDLLGARVTARGLLSDADEADVWDLFPALIVTPMSGLELEAGYHFGDLEDPDFAVRSGQGWYASIGFQVTERIGSSITEFWRDRF